MTDSAKCKNCGHDIVLLGGRWLHSNLHTELEICECGCEEPAPFED